MTSAEIIEGIEAYIVEALQDARRKHAGLIANQQGESAAAAIATGQVLANLTALAHLRALKNGDEVTT